MASKEHLHHLCLHSGIAFLLAILFFYEIGPLEFLLILIIN